MKEYKYANSILWGETYNEKTGMHHIMALSPAHAFDLANRADKSTMGLRFLFEKQPDGTWKNCGDL